MAGTPRIGRRTVPRLSAVAGLAGMTGVTARTLGRSPGPTENEVLVGVSKTAGSPRAVIEADVPGDARVVRENETLGYVTGEFLTEAPDRASENLVSAIVDREYVKYAERNATHEALSTSNDSQYAPQVVNADDVWDTALGSSSVTVAVVDQGIEDGHPEISAQFGTDTGDDSVADDPSPDAFADEYHGTHVAGIAAETTDDEEIGGIGNSSLLSGRAPSEDGSGLASDVADAIEWTADADAHVVTRSLGGGDYTATTKNAVSYATRQGALCVAAGNDGPQGDQSHRQFHAAHHGETVAL